jgi:hypothetical protein
MATFAEFLPWTKVTLGTSGTPAWLAAVQLLEQCLGIATRGVESFLDRRIVFRAPPEVSGAANIVASVAVTNATLTIAAQPNAAGRTFIVTVTDADKTITAGLVTVTGTVGGVVGTTEVFDLTAGLTQYGVKFFTAITSIVVSGLVGNTGADFIKVGSSLGYVEYHFRDDIYASGYGYEAAACRGDLWTRERPIINVLELNEDPNRAYAAATKLVEGTDFIINRNDGRLLRWSGNSPTAWPYGQRVIRNTYSAGYFTAANVPLDIKEVCLSLADRIYKERGREGEMSHSDSLGTVTRFSPAFLTTPMREQLMPYRRPIYDPSMSAEWDLDTEAA